MARPSKSFLFDLVERMLKKRRMGIGLDAGCADFKNRRFFKTEKYVGLDYDLDLLRRGLSKQYNPADIAIYADFNDLLSLTSYSINTLVCTNALDHCPVDKRRKVIENLSDLVRPDGIFIIQFVLDDNFKEYNKSFELKFEKVKYIYYRNFISRLYEKIFEKDGFLGGGNRYFRVLSWLIGNLEWLTCPFIFFNKGVIVIARDRRIEEYQNRSFDLSKLENLGNNLYSGIRKNISAE